MKNAGAVRFDTKYEGGALGEGGERYYNYVRLVRDANWFPSGNGPFSDDPKLMNLTDCHALEASGIFDDIQHCIDQKKPVTTEHPYIDSQGICVNLRCYLNFKASNGFRFTKSLQYFHPINIYSLHLSLILSTKSARKYLRNKKSLAKHTNDWK